MQLSEVSESSQEMDEGLRMGDTGQVTEYYLKEEEVRRKREEEEEEEEKIPTSKETSCGTGGGTCGRHQGILSPMI